MAAWPALAAQQPVPSAPASANPYNLEPFFPDFPVDLAYPQRRGLEYQRTRRQILERLAANLQGNVSRDAWQLAMEFYWRAPDDAVEPLVEAMDRAFGNVALQDFVKNCVEAMGKMANERLDDALRRAAEHKNPNVRQAAFLALASSGKVATLRTMFAWFEVMDPKARGAWLRAVRTRLPQECPPMLRDLMMANYPIAVRDQVLKEALQLAPVEAALVLRGRWTEAVGEFKAIIAAVLHAAGDSAGTAWLQDALAGEDLGTMGLAIRHSTFGELGPLRSDLLRASSHLRPEIRLEAAKALSRVDGDDVADVYEVLAAPDEVWEVKAIALRELTRRGRGKAVGAMLEDLATATGTRLQLLLGQLASSGDPRIVPELLERFRRAPPGEGRSFLQALAQNQSRAAADGLFELFLGEERLVARGSSGEFTTLNYVPTLLLNLRGAEPQVLAGHARIPREDWRRRAAMLPTLGGIAADRADTALQGRCIEPLRTILFDREEVPQLRVLALNLLARRWLSVEDVLRLKNARQQESPGLKALFADFLNENF